MENYEIYTTTSGNQMIKRLSDGVFIPMDEGNSDYQQYLLDTAPQPKKK